ncbi:uncharacterized protein LOC6537700 [Drosophila yakuba]|uniref:Ionotropic glutamate receptor C-terminal domain-containing protein n=1 Tax=Drosophila yakuba TaxID=7245 RepID=B4PLK8_DROYA|nr:uncharacterized protein LOC6537700 [Drosophila yakuba]EDW97957.2 uncharacterized protein Dyak_GE24059 [Drosophila yakuba]
MTLVFNLLFILLLSQAVSEETEFPQLKYLNKVVRLMIKLHKMETLVIVQHHLHHNCNLQHWNSHGMPTIRSDDQGKISMKDTFNSRTLAIVCMGESAHISLLRNVFETFGKMRQQRLILWTQMEPKEDFLKEISNRATEFKLLHLLVLQAGPEGPLSFYRQIPFPSAHFKRIENIWHLNDSEFVNNELNFHGKTAIVKHDYNWTIEMGNIRNCPISRLEDIEVFEFAKKYNLNLQFFNDVDRFDIELRKRIIYLNNVSQPIDFGTPMSFSSLLIVVPCDTYLSLQDVIKQYGIQKWILYIILVYVIFVLIEITFLKVTFRFSTQPHHQEFLNPLVNLYAFRAILGLPFPLPRRSSLSLHQLFLAIVMFGMIISIFINCKLSSMLTKPYPRTQVTNFKELQASGLTVVMDEDANNFIEEKFALEDTKQYMPRKAVLTYAERVKLLISQKDGYAFALFSDNFFAIRNYQRSRGVRAHCSSVDLVIARNVPRVYILGNNSILEWPLMRFTSIMEESGIINHWRKNIPRSNVKNLKEITISNDRVPAVLPLSMEHLTWLWCLLILGYSISMIVFLVEISLKRRKKILKNREHNAFMC